MCIIIVNPIEGDDIDHTVFNRCVKAHPDGMGMAWVQDESIKIMKTLSRTDLLYRKYLEVRKKDAPVLLHFRKATKGGIDISNCHPFWHRGMAFAHNGTLIKKYTVPSGMTDSEAMATVILEKMPDEWWLDSDLFDIIEDYIGFSKIAMLCDTGEFVILNEIKGTDQDGNWFSNYTYKEAFVTTTNKDKKTNGVGNYGGWESWDNHDYEYSKDGSRPYCSYDKRSSMTKDPKPGVNDWGDKRYIVAFNFRDQYFCTHCMPPVGYESSTPVALKAGDFIQCASCLEHIHGNSDAKKLDMGIIDFAEVYKMPQESIPF
jgi:hypothetical protein